MALHNPPFYRYPLLLDWDTQAFEQLKTIGKSKEYPDIFGSESEINAYLVTLIRTQKSLHDWRGYLKDTLAQVTATNSIDTSIFCKKYPPESIDTSVAEWATYEGDKIVNDFIDELATRKIHFVGTHKEIAQFIIQFMFGQLGNDWESTILMIWEMLGDGHELSIHMLNKEMKSFDYLGIF